jgi:hypothetical protein
MHIAGGSTDKPKEKKVAEDDLESAKYTYVYTYMHACISQADQLTNPKKRRL